jgi:hypothetical protein
VKPEIPFWLKPGLEATYLDLDEGGRLIRITGRGSRMNVNTKAIDDKDFKESFPDEEEPEWEEFSLTEWQASYYGQFFIDVTRDPKTHRIYDEPAEYIGMEKVSYESQSHVCFKLRVPDEFDCDCKTTKKRSILSRRSGKCLTCRGILSSLIKCPACGGTGICSFCHGKGVKSAKDTFWFEVKTGILLKYEYSVEDRLVDWERLIRLEPSVLSSID